MEVRISRIHYPLTVLGPGRRIGIWFQGCTIGCQGCMSKDTWDPGSGNLMDVGYLCDIMLAARSDEDLDGVTISGGEPFQQPNALRALCSELRHRWPEVDILVYSGLRLERLRQMHPEILCLIDAVISEPFVEAKPTDARWRGSSNQLLTTLSLPAEVHYDTAQKSARRRLQVTVDEEAVWVVGIPRRGDLDSMRDDLMARGLELEDVSWTT